MFWVDNSFLAMVSHKLSGFTVKSNNPFLAVCRCYLCGDSQKDKTKKRGYFFQQKDVILYKCHNCGQVRSIRSLLKDLDHMLLIEYDMKILEEKRVSNPEIVPIIQHDYLSENPNGPLKKLKKISQLPSNHKAKLYVESRYIPSKFHHKIFYAPKFCEWTNSIVPDKFDLDKGDSPRIVIPFFDKNGEMFGYQGRALDKEAKIRYITIMARGGFTKVYGLQTVDLTKPVYVFEGPIDSMFIDNSVAMAGSDLDIKIIPDPILVFDNEPRNKEIVKKIQAHIKSGNKVCLWPSSIVQKDVNDMILAGMTSEQIKKVIDDNSFQGLAAELEFTNWSKV